MIDIEKIKQAAVIEKLRDACRSAKDLLNNEFNIFEQILTRDILRNALSIPTDSTKVLQEWLDKKLGEPVAYMNSDSFDKLLSTISCWTLVQKDSDAGFHIPLFKKPEKLK